MTSRSEYRGPPPYERERWLHTWFARGGLPAALGRDQRRLRLEPVACYPIADDGGKSEASSKRALRAIVAWPTPRCFAAFDCVP
jgi:hypothetical protein